MTVGITVGGLLAREVAGSDSASGLGQTAGVLGAALVAVPLARISDRAGRRAGLAIGYGVAVLGAVVVVVAAALSSLPLLLVGLFAFGAATACGLQARYAAADLAEPEHRGRACRWSSGRRRSARCSGPTSPSRAHDLGRVARAAGPRRGVRACRPWSFALVALVSLVLLRPDPLLLARRLARRRRAAAGAAARTGAAALRAVWASPGRPARADRRWSSRTRSWSG